MTYNERVALAVRTRDNDIVELKTRMALAEQLIQNANRIHEHGELYPDHAGDEYEARCRFLEKKANHSE